MGLKYANNAKTTLNGAHNDSTTTITVVDGSVFPSLGAGDYFYMTLEDVSLNNEIVKVTARSTNTLTVVRAQNGTTAKSFSTADKAEGRIVAAVLDDLFDITANMKAFLADPTSAKMLAAMLDKTGTGSLVFATSPTFVTPVLGTPTSGVLTNCTGLPNASVIGLGTAALVADSTLAHLAGTETFTGAKTFSAVMKLTTASNEQLQLHRDGAAISWYEATGVTRRGYIQHDSGTTLVIRNEATNGDISLVTTGTGRVLMPNAGGLQLSSAQNTGTVGPAVVGTRMFGHIHVQATDAYSTQKGGLITFGGEYNSSGNLQSTYGAIRGKKHNATNGHSGGGLELLYTNNSTGTMASGLSIDGTGMLTAYAGAVIGGGRTFHNAVNEPFAVAARYVSSGGAVYFGASDGTSTPNAGIYNAAGSVIATFNNNRSVDIGPVSIGLLLQNTATDYLHTIDKDNTGVLFSVNSSSRGFRWHIAGNSFLRLVPSVGMVLDNGNWFYPGVDNSSRLGDASNRWSIVYATTGTINTSDMREKTEFTAPHSGYLAFARDVFTRSGLYQWLDSVEQKGSKEARLHYGVGAQIVEEQALANGLEPNRLALFCEDALTEEYEISPAEKIPEQIIPPEKEGDAPTIIAAFTKEGEKGKRPVIDPKTGEQYMRKGVRIDQLQTLGITALFAEIDTLRARLEALENAA